ncbi:MAG TPA: Os1348 family NHLP clan protein [Dehalococcoidia bacterium]|jgi:hypothetical protein
MADTLGVNAEDTSETADRPDNAQTANPDESLTGKDTILSVLARATNEPEFMSRLAQDPEEALKEYYTLTQEQKMALATGDIQKIESWLGKLDKRLASWLLSQLGQVK